MECDLFVTRGKLKSAVQNVLQKELMMEEVVSDINRCGIPIEDAWNALQDAFGALQCCKLKGRVGRKSTTGQLYIEIPIAEELSQIVIDIIGNVLPEIPSHVAEMKTRKRSENADGITTTISLRKRTDSFNDVFSPRDGSPRDLVSFYPPKPQHGHNMKLNVVSVSTPRVNLKREVGQQYVGSEFQISLGDLKLENHAFWLRVSVINAPEELKLEDPVYIELGRVIWQN